MVWQPHQFSWTDVRYRNGTRSDAMLYAPARHAAYLVAEHALAAGSRGTDATHYHADYVNPGWANALERVEQIGRHIFYR